MRVTVLGAGSWGSTVASLTTARHPTLLWARDPDAAREVNESHTNTRYLPGFTLPRRLRATGDLEAAVAGADVVIVGVPSAGFRPVLEAAAPAVRPWVPIVSLTKGFEQGSLLRMTEIIAEAPTWPGRSWAAGPPPA
jgi:glycerol-3-phosphate dehydrogenase (NAD(P)+)